MATAKVYWLITDIGSDEEPGLKVIRAPYGKLEHAVGQAESDLSTGRRVLRIEQGTDAQQLEGKAAVVWEPPNAG